MRRRHLMFLLVFILFPLTHHAQSRKAQNLKNEFMQSTSRVLNNQVMPLFKWEEVSTINYTIIGDQSVMSTKNWKSFISDMEALTGLKITEVTAREEAHIAIYFTTLDQYAAQEKVKLPEVDISHFDHWIARKNNANYQLKNISFCIVPSTIDRKRGNFRLQNLFLNALGIQGEQDNEYSIFHKYPTDHNRSLSKNDRRIVKMFYLPQVKAGMNSNDLSEVLDASVDMEMLAKEKI